MGDNAMGQYARGNGFNIIRRHKIALVEEGHRLRGSL